ncbi:beta-eliminating lyase-related protein [Pseudoxanthomonas daejeonensis]|uniref:threonine aldolase family protein n=1 Tax=Pseudoxanthomonas daejeonensis TaxID=266062 RepID=UPI001F5479EF|nr:beta-eliminating lyase-related protein [Pseudoxanthomonas daejeonensis]UNK56215.1 beta-eliminating lyase-related protein [Pseudoxanthomonas daejeonensis]
MDRRTFLGTGGVAMAASLLPGASLAAGAAGRKDAPFQRIDLVSDGLALDPREYAIRLQEAVDGGLDADNYSRGGAIERLEGTFARLLGKPAAMFVATGTLANHIAVRRLAGEDCRVLVQAESHLYNDSGDGASNLGGLNLVPLGEGQATLRLDDVQQWVERSRGGRVRNAVGVISIETPVRRRDHAMADFAEIERISRYAREQGIRLHLDGARLFTLPHHSGRSLAEYTALFDTVYVSLWKHFNGASGAILAGSAGFVDGLYHERRMFGGALPGAWPLVAPVEAYALRFQADYAQAWRAADALIGHLQADGRFKARKLADGTSRFFLTVADASAQALPERLRAHDIILSRPHPETGEFAIQVNPTLLRMDPAELARRFTGALAG